MLVFLETNHEFTLWLMALAYAGHILEEYTLVFFIK